MYGYATGIDTRDWALFRSIFADEVTIDFTSYNHALDHCNDEAWFTMGGYYRNELVRTPLDWRITAVTLTVLWRRGDKSIMATAARRGSQLSSPH